MYKGRRIEELKRIVKEGILGCLEHTKYLETAEKMNERLLRAHYLLACAYLRQGNTKKAVAKIEELERIIKEDTPKYDERINLDTVEKLVRAHYLLACIYLKQENIEKAFTHCIRIGNERDRIKEEEKKIEEKLMCGTWDDLALDSEKEEIELKYLRYLGVEFKLSRKIRKIYRKIKQKK